MAALLVLLSQDAMSLFFAGSVIINDGEQREGCSDHHDAGEQNIDGDHKRKIILMFSRDSRWR